MNEKDYGIASLFPLRAIIPREMSRNEERHTYFFRLWRQIIFAGEESARRGGGPSRNHETREASGGNPNSASRVRISTSEESIPQDRNFPQ